MADNDRDKNREEIRYEDLAAVRSRVSWGAILAGAVLALAISFLLTLLGAAIGFSVSDNVDGGNLGRGAAIWAVVSSMIALFIGGWVTSQCCVGENKTEAAVHGVIMWGVVMAMLLWMVSSGVSAGYSAMMDVANVAGNTSQDTWQQAARAAGVSQEQLDQWTQQASAAAQDPQNQEQAAERAQETATQATWWTLGGVTLSILAAVAGALVGAGPTFRLLNVVPVSHSMERRSTVISGS